MTKTQDKAKIHEALELLDAAAAEEQSELRDMIGDHYHTLKEFVGTLGHDVKQEMSGAVESGKSHARAAVSEAGDHMRANAWGYIAASAVLGLLVGVLLTRHRT